MSLLSNAQKQKIFFDGLFEVFDAVLSAAVGDRAALQEAKAKIENITAQLVSSQQELAASQQQVAATTEQLTSLTNENAEASAIFDEIQAKANQFAEKLSAAQIVETPPAV